MMKSRHGQLAVIIGHAHKAVISWRYKRLSTVEWLDMYCCNYHFLARDLSAYICVHCHLSLSWISHLALNSVVECLHCAVRLRPAGRLVSENTTWCQRWDTNEMASLQLQPPDAFDFQLPDECRPKLKRRFQWAVPDRFFFTNLCIGCKGAHKMANS